MTISSLELNWLVVWVSTVALLGWLYIGDAEVSLNEVMIDEGYATGRMMVEPSKEL